jgi:hypothetical protein
MPLDAPDRALNLARARIMFVCDKDLKAKR